jgi:hypothetical protein
MLGLNTVRVEQDGQVTLHRVKGPPATPTYTQATLQLPPEAIEKILHSAAENRLLRLSSSYHNTNIHDGTQWVLFIRQGWTKKAVYFNNRFPDAIERFADDLDRILDENGLDGAQWQPVTPGVRPDKELWNSIR